MEIKEIIENLSKKEAYPHQVGEISHIITAVSVVFLTGEVGYKFNKPLNLGFLDFSTLEKRKEQCEKEVAHNSLISPELYLGVVPITLEEDGSIVVHGNGEVIEYAVKMKQMDPESIMTETLVEGKVTETHVRDLARKLFAFHQIAPTNEHISSFGKEETIQFNWDENFEQTEKYVDQLITPEDFDFIKEKVNAFIQSHKTLWEVRVSENNIKHCHGDFHSGNVFMTERGPVIFDGIVFNERFPCCDVISEVAFMAMDLVFHGYKELADAFVTEYETVSGDTRMKDLLNFYICYRAYIRGKIACFTFEDTNLSEEKKREVKEEAQNYFALAKKYSELF